MAFKRKVARAGRITLAVFTMPWLCLQAPIEQILQEPNPQKQETQLKEWKTLKNNELMNLSFVVSSASLG